MFLKIVLLALTFLRNYSYPVYKQISPILQWPKIYHTRFSIFIPDVNLTEYVEAWVDKLGKHHVINFNNGKSINYRFKYKNPT